MATQDDQQQPGTALAERQQKPMAPLYNGVMSPDRWTMFGRIAHVVAHTEFVPRSIRGKPDAVMACLLYGDSLGLHPSVSLSDIYIADGKPGISGALMAAKIREAGHKLSFKRIGDGESAGWTAIGKRIKDGEVEEEDEWTYTMEDARRAGLYPNDSSKAAWMKTPDVMCRWRALAQLARFLFPDVLRGGTVYTPDEAEEAAYAEQTRMRNGARATGERSEDPAPADEVIREVVEDQWVAQRLIDLFAACNELDEADRYLPGKQRLLVAGKDEKALYELIATLEREILDAGKTPPAPPDPVEVAEQIVEQPIDEDIPFETSQDAEIVEPGGQAKLAG